MVVCTALHRTIENNQIMGWFTTKFSHIKNIKKTPPHQYKLEVRFNLNVDTIMMEPITLWPVWSEVLLYEGAHSILLNLTTLRAAVITRSVDILTKDGCEGLDEMSECITISLEA